MNSKSMSLEYKKLKVNQTILLNTKRTDVEYSKKLFNFGVLDEIRRHLES